MGIGDWGLGIGQSPIPNPQSPIPSILFINLFVEILSIELFIKKIYLNY